MTSSEINYYIEHGYMQPTVKLLKVHGDTCECGQLLNYRISPFMTTERRVCPKCGRLHWVDEPIDFGACER